jgi:hypothetical protein
MKVITRRRPILGGISNQREAGCIGWMHRHYVKIITLEYWIATGGFAGRSRHQTCWKAIRRIRDVRGSGGK